MAFRSRAWKSAKHFAQSCEGALARSDQQERQAELREEIRYCRRVAQRFLFEDLQEFQQLRDEWRQVYLRDRNSPFRRARSASERAAVCLVFVFRDRVLNSQRSSAAYAREVLADAARWLDSAAFAVGHRGSEETREKWRALEEQILTNRVAAQVQRALLFGETEQVRMDPASLSALDRLKETNRTNRKPHVLAQLYEQSLTMIVFSGTPKDRARADMADVLRKARREGALTGPMDADLDQWFGSMCTP